MCIVGQNVFKMCKLIEGNLKPFGFLKGEALSCLDHSWLSNRHVLVAGEGGKVSYYINRRNKRLKFLSFCPYSKHLI